MVGLKAALEGGDEGGASVVVMGSISKRTDFVVAMLLLRVFFLMGVAASMPEMGGVAAAAGEGLESDRLAMMVCYSSRVMMFEWIQRLFRSEV